MATTTRRPSVALFLALVLLASTPFYLLLNLSGGRGEGMRLYVAGLMWCPALAAWLACRAGGLPLSTLGWRWPGARVQWIAYGLPLAYGAAIYATTWLTGLGAFSTEAYAPYAAKAIGFPAWPAWAHVALMVALQVSAGFVLSCASALGEEIGWRGFLAPRLVARFGFGAGSVATGFAWAAWHVPVLFLANFGGETPRAFASACFTASLVASSVVYSWFRERTGSLWPAVFLHASHNVFITPVFSMLTVDTGHTAWAIDEFGFLLVIASALMAAWCWRHRPAPASATAGAFAAGGASR
jgi:membrane protease YdiL (CAAX protease family)